MGYSPQGHEESDMTDVVTCGSDSKESACNVADLGSIVAWEDSLQKGMATYSSVLPWKIPCMQETDGL